MSVDLTPQQQAVLEARQPVVFVEAGAGSGKTFLLVRRYLEAALRDRIPVECLPTVTFTRKAAGELKDRIRGGFLEHGRPDLAWSLEAAPIGTIHSLCSRLLREHVVGAGVDPEFGVLDESAAPLLQSSVWDSVWAEYVTAASGDELDLLALFRKEVGAGIVSLYERLRGSGQENPRFRPSAPPELSSAAEELAFVLEAALADVGAHTAGTAGKNLERLLDCRAWLPGVVADWATLKESARMFPALNCSAATKPVYEGVRGALAAFRQVLAAHCLLPLGETVDALLVAFHHSYRLQKDRLGLLDFADLELLAVGLLERGLRPFPPEARLMVDEFQDTNALQCRLLDLLGAGSMLTVGDYFQSIYAFRGADPLVFVERRRQVGERPPGEGTVLPLACNFRTREPVLAAINHVFAHPVLFGPSFARHEAARVTDAPRPGREAARGALSPAVEVLVLDRKTPEGEERSVRWVEADGVAARIHALVRGEGWSPGDIVILLRSFTHVDRYEEALVALGIPVYVVGGAGYFAHEEVADVIALLKVLLNPRDDLSLLIVLRSPLVGASDDLLYLLRRQAREEAGDGEPLWATVRGHDVAHASPADLALLEGFGRRVADLRGVMGRPGLAWFIERCLETFDYDLVVLGSTRARRRFANLEKLLLLAADFEAVEGPDLRRFVTHLEQRRTEPGARDGSAAVLAEKADVVRIMTVHKAKGLEFPVVVAAGMGRSRSSRDPSFLVGRGGEVAFALGLDHRKDWEDPLGLGSVMHLRDERREGEFAEEMRLAYVAMTRAEERLLVSGIVSEGTPAREDPFACLLCALGYDVATGSGEERPLPDVDLVVRRLDAGPWHSAVGAEVGSTPPESAAGDVPVSLDAEAPVTQPRIGPAPPPPPFLPMPGGWAAGGPVSFSSLDLYERCPRRFYLERVLGLHSERSEPEPAAAAAATEGVPWDAGGHDEPDGRTLGTVVHRVLELADLTERPDPETLTELVDQAVDGLDPVPGTAVLEEAPLLAAAFWDSPLAEAPALRTADKETPFVFAHGDLLVTGVFDVLLRDDGCWRIVDYKTNHLEGRSGQQVAADYALQAKVYALAGLLAGAGRVTMSFLLLRAPADTEDQEYTAADIPSLRSALDQATAGLLRGEYPLRSGKWCALCAQEELCRVLGPS